MKIAKALLIGMYVHLLLSIAVPIGLILLSSEGVQDFAGVIIFLYLITILTVQIVGWITVGMGASTARRGNLAELRSALKLLKLGSIPFYILNFIYSFVVWFILVAASRGTMIFLVPIPIIITCSMIVQSGCIGAFYIKALRKIPGSNKKPSGIHYILQFISVLDVVSTLMILRKKSYTG